MSDPFEGLEHTLGGDDNLVTMHDDFAGRFSDPIAARQYIRAGKATVTMKSSKTGQRFTFRVRAARDGAVHFVDVLNGSDNESSYAYLGILRRDMYQHGRKSRVGDTAASVVAFKWAWAQLAKGRLPTALEIWHAGVCGRCGRKLTVPESVAAGLGPECAGKVGA